MTAELPAYQRLAENVEEEVDILQWFEERKVEIPNWGKYSKVAALIQPSSGASERVFSMLSNLLTQSQSGALQDYIECSLMLRYNNRK